MVYSGKVGLTGPERLLMEIELACIVAGTVVFTGFVVGAGIIYSGLDKVAAAISGKGERTG